MGAAPRSLLCPGAAALQLCPGARSAWGSRPEVEHGRLSVVKEQYLEPEEVKVQCDCSYHMVGPAHIACSENGTWSPEPPTCAWEIAMGCDEVVAAGSCCSASQTRRTCGWPWRCKLSLEIEQLDKV